MFCLSSRLVCVMMANQMWFPPASVYGSAICGTPTFCLVGAWLKCVTMVLQLAAIHVGIV